MAYEQERELMVSAQLEGRGISNPQILEAFRNIPRHIFVRKQEESVAYEDRPLPIGLGQTISQPYMMAHIAQCMGLQGHETILEIGCGSGYFAAVLGKLAKLVYTIDRYPEFVQHAKSVFTQLGITNVTAMDGDGLKGYQEAAPFDVILVSAHGSSVPEALLDQLKVGGQLIMPIGSNKMQMLYKIIKQADGYTEIPLGECRFVPLITSDHIDGLDDDVDEVML